MAIKPKERLTAKEWLDTAEQFEVSSHALMENKPQEMHGVFGGPYITLRAFGIEAYLKCLIELDDRQPSKTHNFGKLDAEIRVAAQRRNPF